MNILECWHDRFGFTRHVVHHGIMYAECIAFDVEMLCFRLDTRSRLPSGY